MCGRPVVTRKEIRSTLIVTYIINMAVILEPCSSYFNITCLYFTNQHCNHQSSVQSNAGLTQRPTTKYHLY